MEIVISINHIDYLKSQSHINSRTVMSANTLKNISKLILVSAVSFAGGVSEFVIIFFKRRGPTGITLCI